VSLITKRLLDDGLLKKGEPVRGKVGQPSVPLSLDPDGAFSVGIKVGRRSMDLLLVDFSGQVRQRWQAQYEHADPDTLLPAIGARLKEVAKKLGQFHAQGRERVQGVGLAAPLNPGGWQKLLGTPDAVAARWQGLDLAAEVSGLCEWPVTAVKDTAAACVAELVAGRGRSVKSFLYVFVDTFIGGGLVLDSHLREGVHGNAGAVGSLPLWLPSRGRAAPAQLLSVASLITLERAYAAAGLEPDATGDERALEPPWRAATDAWLESAGTALAQAVQTASCLLDLEGAIVDGNMSRALLAELLAATLAAMRRHDWEGVAMPELLPGTIGSDARALGGALLPLHANFAPDRELFIKALG